MSDTPIFDRLAAERGYDRMIAPVRVPSYPGTPLKVMGIMAPGMYINEWNRGQTDDIVDADPSDTEGGEIIVFRKPIPVTTLADLAKGQHQE